MRFLLSVFSLILFLHPGANATNLDQVLAKNNRAFVVVYLDHQTWPKQLDDQLALTQMLQEDALENELGSGFEVTHRFQAVPALAGWINTATFEAWQIRRQKNLSNIRSINLDVGGQRQPQTSAGGGGLADSIPLVRADILHQMGITGDGIEVAILDTGFDSDHPDLTGALLAEACFCNDNTGGCCPNGSATQTGSGSAEEDHGHGTHVTGIVTSDGVQAGKGVAPGARITAVKMLDANNSFQSTADITASLDWVYVNRPDVDIVSMSIYTFVTFTQTCDSAVSWTQALYDAVQNLTSKGVFVVTIAGNFGTSGDLPAPGCLSNIVTVGASNKSDGMYSGSNSHPNVDLIAPGQNIVSSGFGGGTAMITGTSMACPHVAGTAALFLQANPTLTQTQIVDALIETGVPITDQFGLTKPRIDVKAAYDKLFGFSNLIRWVPHVTAPGGGFKTSVHLYNQNILIKRMLTITLTPFDFAGNQLTPQNVTLMPGQLFQQDADILFAGEQVSHFAIDGPGEVHVNIAYQADVENAATAHVPELFDSVQELVFEPAEWDLVFDGMALVNVGQGNSSVFVTQFDENGGFLNARDYTQNEPLKTYEKLLVVFGSDFTQVPGAYFKIETTEPSQILLLRGTYPGTSPSFLYQTNPLSTVEAPTILKSTAAKR